MIAGLSCDNFGRMLRSVSPCLQSGRLTMEHKRYRRAALLLVMIQALVCWGCGYRFGDTRSEWVSKGYSLAIPTFQNDSFMLGAENEFTAAARSVFARRGGFALSERDGADYILHGRIVSIDDSLGARRMEIGGHRAGTYEIKVRVELTLKDPSGAALWSSSLSGRTDFIGSGQIVFVRDNRREALARLAEEMMRRGYLELAEGF